jgi:cell pole-organizing protein PopZ
MAQTNTVQREPSMEEILASIRKIIEESDGARSSPAQPEPLADLTPAEPTRPHLSEVDAFRADLARRREPEIVSPVEQPSPTGTSVQMEEKIHSAPVREVAEPATYIDDVELAAELSKPVGEKSVADQASGGTKQGILSHYTQQQVAQSFGELSEAFLASRRKSFDEMAEEMLRPMLQDWLDNNLPVLVERLVREEIERVARGVTG